MYEYGNVIDGGERDIFLISGCLSRSTVKVSTEISFALN